MGVMVFLGWEGFGGRDVGSRLELLGRRKGRDLRGICGLVGR